MRSVTVAGYTFTLGCLNGAIHKATGDFFRIRHTGDKDKLRDNVKSAVEWVFAESDGIIAKFKKALDMRITSPVDYLRDMSRKHNLTQEQFKAMLDDMVGINVRGGEPTLYDMSQLVSLSAKRWEGDRRFEMATVSTDILTEPSEYMVFKPEIAPDVLERRALAEAQAS